MSRTTLSQQLTELQAKNSELLADLQTVERRLDSLTSHHQLELSNLKTLHAGVIAEFEKKLKDKDNTQTYISGERSRLESEIEQAHAVLDSVDGAPSREYEKEYGKGTRNIVTRLAGAFLSIARGSK